VSGVRMSPSIYFRTGPNPIILRALSWGDREWGLETYSQHLFIGQPLLQCLTQ
jgi:hypothetical protein